MDMDIRPFWDRNSGKWLVAKNPGFWRVGKATRTHDVLPMLVRRAMGWRGRRRETFRFRGTGTGLYRREFADATRFNVSREKHDEAS